MLRFAELALVDERWRLCAGAMAPGVQGQLRRGGSAVLPVVIARPLVLLQLRVAAGPPRPSVLAGPG
jgi:hypothetical protein